MKHEDVSSEPHWAVNEVVALWRCGAVVGCDVFESSARWDDVTADAAAPPAIGPIGRSPRPIKLQVDLGLARPLVAINVWLSRNRGGGKCFTLDLYIFFVVVVIPLIFHPVGYHPLP